MMITITAYLKQFAELNKLVEESKNRNDVVLQALLLIVLGIEVKILFAFFQSKKIVT